jgi:pimeloyl-ACP methyl ester carboxylesterase
VIPMLSVLYPYQSDKRAKNLLVMLPGAYEAPEDFDKQGFVQAVRKRQLPIDCLAVDAHLGYTNNGSIPERLLHDVIQPARAQGYVNIWVMGISLGGLGALLLNMRYPSTIQGIVALAPYIGTRDTLDKVRAGGGLSQWVAPSEIGPKDWETPLMASLKTLSAKARIGQHTPYLWLGYGASDRFAESLSVLQAALPSAQTTVVPGGHDWLPWIALWDRALNDLSAQMIHAGAQ